MKNITIKLDDDIARWCKLWAAQHDTSVSGFLGELLRSFKQERTGYARAMHQFLSVEPTPLKRRGELYPRRDVLHERS